MFCVFQKKRKTKNTKMRKFVFLNKTILYSLFYYNLTILKKNLKFFLKNRILFLEHKKEKNETLKIKFISKIKT